MAINVIGTPVRDEVLDADYFLGEISYGDTLLNIYPLIQRLNIQRNLQEPSFYSRLRKDLKIGCVMPSITIAFINKDNSINIDSKANNLSL